MLIKTQETIFKVFGNRERLNLFLCLSAKKNVTELMGKCSLSQSALSQHLKVLRDAQFVECVRNGREQVYQVKDKEALRIAKSIVKYISQ